MQFKKNNIIKNFKLNFLSIGLSLLTFNFGIVKEVSAELLFSNENFNSTSLISIEKADPKRIINVKNVTKINEKTKEELKNKNLNSSSVMAKKSEIKTQQDKDKDKDKNSIKKQVQELPKIPQYNPQIVGKQKKGGTCWDSAAKYHGVDPWLLYSIAYTESRFNPNAVGKNKNGTYDLGMMQINDRVWLPKLNKMGITKKMLKDPCVSIYVGAWILKQNINEFGYTAKAIGAYNSRTPVHNQRYAKKVYEAYAKFTKIYKMKN